MYGKIFDSFFDSSIMDEPLHVRYALQCLIGLADAEGFVDMTVTALARRIGLSVEQTQDAIERLSSPDPLSRSSAEEGRRLVPIRDSYGWKLVNYEHYRAMAKESDRREYMRRYMAEYRSKEPSKPPVNKRKQPLAKVKTARVSVSDVSEREGEEKFDRNSDPYRLALLLHEKLKERDPKAKRPNLQGWAGHVDKMLRLDGRKPDEVRKMIEFTQGHKFWRKNIRSTEKLRDQFSQLLDEPGCPLSASSPGERTAKNPTGVTL